MFVSTHRQRLLSYRSRSRYCEVCTPPGLTVLADPARLPQLLLRQQGGAYRKTQGVGGFIFAEMHDMQSSDARAVAGIQLDPSVSEPLPLVGRPAEHASRTQGGARM